MTAPDLIERITRSLAYMLRHQPQEFDLELDAQGFAEIDEVVRALNERLGEPVVREDLESAIHSGDRPRYEMRDDRVRALYGHSIPVEPGEPSKPPEVLYVGLSLGDADRALRQGLSGGRRRFLHLARTIDDARESGRRTGMDYSVLAVQALEAWEEGINFFDRQALFLSDTIPTKYIRMIERELMQGQRAFEGARGEPGSEFGESGGEARGEEAQEAFADAGAPPAAGASADDRGPPRRRRRRGRGGRGDEFQGAGDRREPRSADFAPRSEPRTELRSEPRSEPHGEPRSEPRADRAGEPRHAGPREFRGDERSRDRGHGRFQERGRDQDRRHDRGPERAPERGPERAPERGHDRAPDRGYDRAPDRGHGRAYDRPHDRGPDRPERSLSRGEEPRRDRGPERRPGDSFGPGRGEPRPVRERPAEPRPAAAPVSRAEPASAGPDFGLGIFEAAAPKPQPQKPPPPPAPAPRRPEPPRNTPAADDSFGSGV